MVPKNCAPSGAEQQSDDGDCEIEGLEFTFSGRDVTGRRSDWIELIESNDGSVSDSISVETDYLVVNASTTLVEREFAANHGVPIIDESGLPVFLNSQGIDWGITSK